MDTKQLKYFLAVAKTGSFSKAAEEQFITQTTMSYHISLLEDELGVKLLDRSNRQVQLTQAGLKYREKAKLILEQMEEAKELAVQTQNDYEGVLNIGYFGHSLYEWLPKALKKLLKKHPRLRLQVRQRQQTELIEGLEKNEFDCILCTDYGLFSQTPWMKKMCLYADPISLLVFEGHWAAGRESVRLEELAGERFALMVEKDLWEREEAFPVENAEIQFVNSHDDLILLVRSGYAITMGASQALKTGLSGLCQIPVEDYHQYDNNYICWRKENTKEILQRFMEILNCTKDG